MLPLPRHSVLPFLPPPPSPILLSSARCPLSFPLLSPPYSIPPPILLHYPSLFFLPFLFIFVLPPLPPFPRLLCVHRGLSKQGGKVREEEGGAGGQNQPCPPTPSPLSSPLSPSAISTMAVSNIRNNNLHYLDTHSDPFVCLSAYLSISLSISCNQVALRLAQSACLSACAYLSVILAQYLLACLPSCLPARPPLCPPAKPVPGAHGRSTDIRTGAAVSVCCSRRLIRAAHEYLDIKSRASGLPARPLAAYNTCHYLIPSAAPRAPRRCWSWWCSSCD